MNDSRDTNDCIFCKIVTKEIPAYIVYEDSDFLAFLDIDPLSPGHTLIIPKEHYRWVWDVPTSEGEFSAYFELCRKIALAQRKAFGVEMILSRIVGEEVPHAHVLVFPDKAATKTSDMKDFEKNKGKLIEALGN